jgi:uncharacterized protein YjbI with pentapeptide repeats
MSIHQDDGNDFSDRDIRGRDFSQDVYCINSKFQHSKAGIKPIFYYSLVMLFCLLSILISVAIAIAILPILAGITPYWIPSLIGLSILGIFLFFLTIQGFTGALLAAGIVSVISLISIIPLLIAKEHTIVPGVFFGILGISIAFGGIVMFAFTITVLDVLSNRLVKYVAMIMSIAVMVVSVPIVFPRNNKPPNQFDYLIDIILTGIILSIGFYIAFRSLHQDKRFKSIRLAAISFCSRYYSTSFRGVNLTNADFTGAMLRNVDFREANLTMTRFFNAEDIEYAYLDENHSLQNSKTQRLAITLDVNKLSDKNFNYLDLEGINLESAYLQGASFIGANLKNANLKNADLSGANLKQAQLVGADLAGATLTGACIEDWGITKGTVLEEVKCEFIFLGCKEEHDKNGHSLIKFQQKYPDDRKFEDGEFAQRSYLAWEKYEKNKTTTMNFYDRVENVMTIEYNSGEINMSQSKGNVSISGVQGNVSGIAAAGENQTLTGVAIGAISGSVTNTINQLPTSPDPDNPGIKELLAQLQAAIETESELPDEDKAEALEQVKALAEAGQKPEDNVLQKAAKTSMKILKGTIASLPDTAKLAESCVKLLPVIASLLALV